jgi:hypothetical protein
MIDVPFRKRELKREMEFVLVWQHGELETDDGDGLLWPEQVEWRAVQLNIESGKLKLSEGQFQASTDKLSILKISTYSDYKTEFLKQSCNFKSL